MSAPVGKEASATSSGAWPHVMLAESSSRVMVAMRPRPPDIALHAVPSLLTPVQAPTYLPYLFDLGPGPV